MSCRIVRRRDDWVYALLAHMLQQLQQSRKENVVVGYTYTAFRHPNDRVTKAIGA